VINYDIVDFWLRNGFHLCILFHWKIDPLNSSNARIINFLRDFISKLGDDQSPDTQNTSSSRKSSEHTLIRDSNGNVLHPHTLTLSGYNNYCKDLGRFVLCSWRAHYRVLNFLLQRAAISKTINDLRVFWFSTCSPSSLCSYNIHSVYQRKKKLKNKIPPRSSSTVPPRPFCYENFETTHYHDHAGMFKRSLYWTKTDDVLWDQNQ